MAKIAQKKPKIKLITNQHYLPTLLKLLDTAQKSIDIISYSFAIGSAAGKLNENGMALTVARKLEELKQKRGKSLTIRLYVEGVRDTVYRNRVTGRYLAKAGVIVKYGATHAKGFCIDGKAILFGSTNLTHQSIMKNNEANLFIADPKMSSEFMLYFEHLWSGGKHGGVKLAGPLVADGDFKDAIIGMINRASIRIEFSIYFFNHREIEKALIKAHQRGVVIIGFIHQHNSFALPYIRANYATVKRLRASGITHLVWSVPTTFSHAKFIVVDRKELALGTGNWLVEDVKVHPQLYIHLKDAPLAKELVKFLTWEVANQSVANSVFS